MPGTSGGNTRPTIQRAAIALSAVVMAGLAVITLLAMVIAPECTGIAAKADVYKIISTCAFFATYYLLVWRRGSVMAAVTLLASQVASGLLFVSYIDSLPLGCLQ